MDTREHSDRLISLLERQQTLVAELGGLAGRQRELVSGSRTDALLTLLADRQRIVDELLASQEETGELARAIEQAPITDQDQRTRIRTLIDTIGRELDAVMRRDAEDQEVLTAGRDATRRELDEVGTARQAHAAYLRPPVSTNRFADQRG